MANLRIGDIVSRKSYDYDILFKVVAIKEDIADLIGMTVRIIADAPIYDLKIMSDNEITTAIKTIEANSRFKINRCYNNINNRFNVQEYNKQFQKSGRIEVYQKDSVYKKPGVILHLDRRCRICYKMQRNI